MREAAAAGQGWAAVASLHLRLNDIIELWMDRPNRLTSMVTWVVGLSLVRR